MFGWLFKKKKLSYDQWWAKYREYLQSDKWKKIRLKVLTRDDFECQQRKFVFFKCRSKKKLQVHHISYKYVFKEHKNLKTLITLCESCHNKEHERLKKIKRKK